MSYSNEPRLSRKGAFILLLLYFAGVLFLCLFDFRNSGVRLSPTFWGIPTDKIVHFCMLLPFPIIAFLNVAKIWRPRRAGWALAAIFILGVAFGAATEIMQGTLTSYRSEDVLDLVADGAGALAGTLITGVVHKRLVAL